MKATQYLLTIALIALVASPLETSAADEAPAKEKLTYEKLAGDVQLDEVDFAPWRAVPVFHSGRVMPMDTLAKVAMETICGGGSRVKLGFEGYVSPDDLAADSRYQPALEIFPGGLTRKMQAVEVMLSWLSEPEKWEDVPFILCEHKDLHAALGLKSKTELGLHRKFVSPRMIAESTALQDYMADMRDRSRAVDSAGGEFKMNETDKKVNELRSRYQIFRRLTHDPRLPLNVSETLQPGNRDEFLAQLSAALALMDDKSDAHGNTLEDMLVKFIQRQEKEQAESRIADVARLELGALQEVRILASRMFPENSAAHASPHGDDVPTGLPTLEETEAATVFLRRASLRLDHHLTALKDELYESDFSDNPDIESGQTLFRELAFKAHALHKLARQMHLALYDNGGQFKGSGKFRNGASVYVTPALNVTALAKNRSPGDNSKAWEAIQAQPWLSLPTVLYGSDDLLYHEEWESESYNREHIDAVRGAWKTLAETYTNRQHPNRAAACRSAQADVAVALRTLGEGLEPQRRKLVEEELSSGQRDEHLIEYTQYPSAARIQPELVYNRVKPFQWSWVICFFSVLAFALAFGGIRKVAFWAALGFLMLAVAWTIYAFYLRVMVTRWAPVTNMYETVVFVPTVIAVLAMWFLLLPLLWPGISNAWRMTGLPFTWEAASLTDRQRNFLPQQGWMISGILSAFFRLALMAYAFYFLAMAPYADGNRTIFYLLPNFEAATGGLSEKFNLYGVYFINLVCLLALVWLLPRAALTAVISLVTVPLSLLVQQRQSLHEALPQVYSRQAFGLAGALGACFFFLVAASAAGDVLDENFSPLQPVLRSNFWLTVHVLTIVASYGAGLLAWLIGMIALTHYLFGHYRRPVVATNIPKGMQPAKGVENSQRLAKLPPEECATLAHYAYRAVQVAVLLLATGTILGGLWADVSWGRFWGWDPKEVWALISLLVYLAILHGRYTGWFNNFGMIFGTVLGAMAIAFSWYGVNFILPMVAPDGMAGLHAYGTGSGGLWFVATTVGVSLAYLIAASIRYSVETATQVVPVQHTPEIPGVFQADIAGGDA